MRRLAKLALPCAILCAALPAPPAAAQQPIPAEPVVIDGPGSGILGLAGLSIARDGTGGLVYMKQVSGVPHVFLSRLSNGVFQPPTQLDSAPALNGASSEPVIAAGNDGVLLVAFINGGSLYAVDSTSLSGAPAAPIDLFDGALHPAIQMSDFGKGYLVFTAVSQSGHDVRSAYFNSGTWSVESASLNAVPANDAGTGAGRPQVAAAGDGVAIVTWGEAGHVYSRRVWGTSPSVVYQRADVPAFSGWSEVSSGEPVVGAGGDSSYADVAFHEVLRAPSGAQQQSRVLMRRLRGSQYENIGTADGLTTGATDGADQPQIAMTEFGHGFVTSSRNTSHALFATLLGDNGARQYAVGADSLPNTIAPNAVPATAGIYSDLIAWQQSPGASGPAEVRVRYAPDGAALGPEVVVSSPALGAVQATGGLAAAGDVQGDAAIAWVQGTGSSTQIVADQLYQGPGSALPLSQFQYLRIPQPVFTWSPARESWGAVSYLVTLDGSQIAETPATSIEVPSSLADGPHTWQVAAVNEAGLKGVTSSATVWIDTVAPAVTVTQTGVRQVGSSLHIDVRYTDAPPPEPPADASGIGRVTVAWGDGSTDVIRHGKSHAYRLPGRYVVRVTVSDRAGNATTVVRKVQIAPRPQKKRRVRKRTRRRR